MKNQKINPGVCHGTEMKIQGPYQNFFPTSLVGGVDGRERRGIVLTDC